MLDALLARLNLIPGIQFAECEWATRPKGDFGTAQLDFMSARDVGDDRHLETAWQGSVDVYTHGKKREIAQAVEAVLEDLFGSCWELNSQQAEHDTGLFHREYVFDTEVE